MANVNEVTLIGRLTQDPEVRFTPNGAAVADLNLAINRRYRAKNEQREETAFVKAVVWGTTAENAGKYLQKGSEVYVKGRLTTNEWKDKEGKDRSQLVVTCENLQFLGGNGNTGGTAAGQRGGPQRGGTPSGAGAASSAHSGVTVGFGSCENQTPEQLDDKSLAWYTKVYAENVTDPKKARFKDKNQQVLAALHAEARRRSGQASLPGSDEEFSGDESDDVPF